MSLHHKLVITRWLERMPSEQRRWKKCAAAVVQKRRKSQPTINLWERKEAILSRVKELAEAALAGAAEANSTKDPDAEK